MKKNFNKLLTLSLCCISFLSWGQDSTFYTNGSLKTVGKTIDGNKEGTWQFYYSTGELNLIAKYKNDTLEGVSTSYYPNGEVKSILQYHDGLLTDTAKFFFSDGTLKEKGICEDDFYTGQWIEYYPEGEVHVLKDFKYSAPVGEWQYLDPKQHLYKKEYYNDQEGLVLVEDYRKGRLLARTAYKNEQAHGDFKMYNKKGVMVLEGQYENGEKVGLWKSYSNKGKLKSEMRY